MNTLDEYCIWVYTYFYQHQRGAIFFAFLSPFIFKDIDSQFSGVLSFVQMHEKCAFAQSRISDGLELAKITMFTNYYSY